MLDIRVRVNVGTILLFFFASSCHLTAKQPSIYLLSCLIAY